jgi:hydrogenase maturation protease
MKLLIAGIGNIFLGDDAFGVEVVRRLAARNLPGGVRIVDFGIRSYDLAYALMDDWDLVILVDAVPRGGPPGTLYVIEPAVQDVQPDVDAHAMNPVAVLQMATALGGRLPRMLLVGCEPSRVEASVEGEFGLSEPVEAAVPEAIRTIEDIVARFRAGAAAA